MHDVMSQECLKFVKTTVVHVQFLMLLIWQGGEGGRNAVLSYSGGRCMGSFLN